MSWNRRAEGKNTFYILRQAILWVTQIIGYDTIAFSFSLASLFNIVVGFLMDQVKRLYDTFHEPFKRVVSNNPPVPETPVCKDAEPCLTSEFVEADKDTENASKRRKKEPEMNVKSALTAAFAKYAGKISKKNNKLEGNKGGETSAAAVPEAATKNSKEGVEA